MDGGAVTYAQAQGRQKADSILEKVAHRQRSSAQGCTSPGLTKSKLDFERWRCDAFRLLHDSEFEVRTNCPNLGGEPTPDCVQAAPRQQKFEVCTSCTNLSGEPASSRATQLHDSEFEVNPDCVNLSGEPAAAPGTADRQVRVTRASGGFSIDNRKSTLTIDNVAARNPPRQRPVQPKKSAPAGKSVDDR